MLQYFQIGIVIFLLWCLAIPILKRAPSRLKFYLTLIAIAAWLIPWQLIQLDLAIASNSSLSTLKNEKLQLVSSLVERINVIHDDDVGLAPSATSSSAISNQVAEPNENIIVVTAKTLFASFLASKYIILGAAFFVGLLLFIIDWLRFCDRQKGWLARSKPCNELAEKYSLRLRDAEIRLLSEAPPGMATGFRHPIIWLSQEVKNCHHQKTILLHELVHIQNRDTCWLWVINFCKRLLWWNPVVWLLAKRALDFMEYSCDEQCSRQQHEINYRLRLAELVLEQNRSMSSHTVLGIYQAESLNVLRIKSLGTPKQLGFIHIGFLCFAGPLALTLCLSLLNNARDRLDATGFLSTPLSIQNLTTVVDVPSAQKPLFTFAETVRKKDYKSAKEMYNNLYNDLMADKDNQAFGNSQRALAFRVMAMYLSDIGEDAAVLDLADKILAPSVQLNNSHVNRILAIANIRIGEYGDAIGVLEAADKIRLRLGPSTVLLAQAYHLKGDFAASANVVNEQLPYFKTRTNYFQSRIAVLRILGKNYALLNNVEGVLKTKAALGEHAPDDFSSVKIDQVKMPYVYFNYRSVAGVTVDRGDERKLPLPDRPLLTGYVPVDQLLTSAAVYGRYQEFDAAAKTVGVALAKYGADMAAEHKLNTLEYLFVLQVLASDINAAEKTADRLTQDETTHPLVSERAQHFLNIAKLSGPQAAAKQKLDSIAKYLQDDDINSLAADHEAVKLYSGAVDSSPARDAAINVMAFYQEHSLAPDIKTLNSLTAIFENLGKHEEVSGMRSILEKFYPRAYNFIFEGDA